jgi:hypothetical protein
MKTTMAECISCRKPLTGTEPPEHVIPQSFGTFHPNLTIFYVCADCNRLFGRTLEWPMRNSSTEGPAGWRRPLAFAVCDFAGPFCTRVRSVLGPSGPSSVSM